LQVFLDRFIIPFSKRSVKRFCRLAIEKVLEKIHKKQTDAQGSGRTDSGVHAVGQTVTFISPIDNMDAKNYIPAMNSLLPQDIRIVDSKEVPMDFSARFNATSRTYRYFINCAENPMAHQMPYSWAIRDSLISTN
jgi:tRNA pseudouridine38-40 synthase